MPSDEVACNTTAESSAMQVPMNVDQNQLHNENESQQFTLEDEFQYDFFNNLLETIENDPSASSNSVSCANYDTVS